MQNLISTYEPDAEMHLHQGKAALCLIFSPALLSRCIAQGITCEINSNAAFFPSSPLLIAWVSNSS
jgi:hypothetical protein